MGNVKLASSGNGVWATTDTEVNVYSKPTRFRVPHPELEGSFIACGWSLRHMCACSHAWSPSRVLAEVEFRQHVLLVRIPGASDQGEMYHAGTTRDQGEMCHAGTSRGTSSESPSPAVLISVQ